MTRMLLIVTGMLMMLKVLVIDQKLRVGKGVTYFKIPSSQMALAADPAMKYISEDSPYMRSER